MADRQPPQHAAGLAPAGADLETRLQRRYIRDGQTGVADFNGWTRYERPSLPSDPDVGLLFQDAEQLPAQLAGLERYHRPAQVAGAAERSRAGLLGTPDPFRPTPQPSRCVYRDVATTDDASPRVRPQTPPATTALGDVR